MIERIELNEKRLDSITTSIKELEHSLENFNSIKKEIKSLNKYYGSKNWFKDKDSYENNKIDHIKAGVLSEDAVWNMDEDLNSLIDDMKEIINYLEK